METEASEPANDGAKVMMLESLLVLLASQIGNVPSIASCSNAALANADETRAMAASAEDLDRFMAFYAPNVVQWGQNPPIVGRQAVRTSYKKLFALDASEYSLILTVKKASVSKSCDMGYTRGEYRVRMRLGTADSFVERGGVYTALWKPRVDGGWQVVDEVFSHFPL